MERAVLKNIARFFFLAQCCKKKLVGGPHGRPLKIVQSGLFWAPMRRPSTIQIERGDKLIIEALRFVFISRCHRVMFFRAVKLFNNCHAIQSIPECVVVMLQMFSCVFQRAFK